MASWNPWHGCRKVSPGCAHCYVYRIDAAHGRSADRVVRTGDFRLPLRRNRQGDYRIPAGETVYTCFTSDFLLPEADPWRPEAWRMIRERMDLSFFFITKRIERLEACLPPDWGPGYPHVTIGCTVENQDRADFRLPIFRAAPVRRKVIVCEPLLEAVHLEAYLGDWVREVSAGGESGPDARTCDYAWILGIREACRAAGVGFHYHQTGAWLIKDGRLYHIPRRAQGVQALRAAIDLEPVCPAPEEVSYGQQTFAGFRPGCG